MPKSLFDDLKVDIVVDAIATNERLGSRDAMGFSIKERNRVLRKLDWRVLPLFSLLYLLSALDRNNIGNAKIAGMSTDLNLVGLRYNTAASVFFVTYCLGQVPSNIILKLTRPSRWLPSIMVVWGLITTLTCLVKTYHELLVVRVFLGVAESGFYPGVIYYITMLYPRADRAKRLALFVAPANLSGAVSGLLAYAIVHMNGIGGLHAWQWIFCLEGLVTVLVALVAFFVIYDSPETASFLTDAEKSYLIESLKNDSQGLATHYSFKFVLQAFKDYRVYLLFGICIGMAIPGSGIALFTPSIITELGFSTTNAQLLSAIPSVAGCTCAILCGMYSDRLQLRGPFVMAGSATTLVGFILLYTQTSPGPALTGVVIAAIGTYPVGPIFLTWVSSNAGGDIKRGVTIAMITGVSNVGGVCASFVFFDPPRYHVGLEIIMGLLCFVFLLSSFMMWHYKRINHWKERMCCEHGITDDDRDKFRDHGDDSPLFRYTI